MSALLWARVTWSGDVRIALKGVMCRHDECLFSAGVHRAAAESSKMDGVVRD